jgi:hypothetical protein
MTQYFNQTILFLYAISPLGLSSPKFKNGLKTVYQTIPSVPITGANCILEGVGVLSVGGKEHKGRGVFCQWHVLRS